MTITAYLAGPENLLRRVPGKAGPPNPRSQLGRTRPLAPAFDRSRLLRRGFTCAPRPCITIKAIANQPPGTSLVSTAGISAAGSPLTTASSSAAKSPGSPAAILSAAVQCSMARPSGRPSRSHRKYAASRNALLGVVWLHRALPWITQQRSRGARVRDSCSARTSPRDRVLVSRADPGTIFDDIVLSSTEPSRAQEARRTAPSDGPPDRR